MSDTKKSFLILFDVAGTLVTFRSDLRTERLTKLCSLSADELNAKLFIEPNSPGIQFDRGEIIASVFYDLCCEIMGVQPTQEFAAQFREGYQNIIEPRPEMGELLQRLSESCELWMCSNTNVWHVDQFRKVAPYAKYLTRMCNSHNTGFVKPEPGIFEEAIRISQRTPDQIIFVDDRQDNVNAAKKLGIQAIHFTSAADLSNRLAEIMQRQTAGA